MAFDWAELVESPAFNLGLGLLASAPTATPFAGAADQLNRYQALKQQRDLQRMHGQVYEAQAAREREAAAEKERARKQREAFLAQYNPNAPIGSQMALGVQSGALDPQDALLLQFRQAEQKARNDADNAAAAERNAATLEQRREAATMRDEAQRRHDQTLMAMKQLGVGLGRGNADLQRELLEARIEATRAGTEAKRAGVEQKAAAGNAKQQSARAVAEFSLDQTISALDRLKENAQELKNHPGLKGITGVRGAWVPDRINAAFDPQAANAGALLEGLKAKTSLDVLNSFRAMSKTGGSVVGPASDRDVRLAGDYIAGLDRSQTEGEFQNRLDKIVEFVEEAKPRYRKLFEEQFGGGEGSTPAAAPSPQRQVVRTGRTKSGKRAVQYSDGTTAILD